MPIRRRKRKFTWMPNFGQTFQAGESEYHDSSIQTTLIVAGNTVSSRAVEVFPVIRDQPQEDEETFVLNDIINNEWFLERIVGKIHAGVYDSGNTDLGARAVAQIRFSVGFFVAGVDKSNPTQVLGDAIEEYAVHRLDNVRQPWIWRRHWVLQNNQAINPTASGYPIFPSTTVGYGSVADGGHIDAKSVRRIHQQERLWCAMEAVRWPLDTVAVSTNGAAVIANLDIRVLGALRRAKGQSTFT